MIPLASLPPDHPARVRPLVGTWYRSKDGGPAREVLPAYRIARRSYNDLGPAWTGSEDFFATKPAKA